MVNARSVDGAAADGDVFRWITRQLLCVQVVIDIIGVTAIAVTVIGVAGAILFPMDDITGFLYLIGSVFAPMIAVQIADHFILRRDRFAVAADARNLVIWLVGFLAYRLLMGVDTPVGYTLPAMVLTVLLCILAEKIKPTVKA